MLLAALTWAWERYRPPEGWLSLFLLWAAVACLTASIVAVDWVPEIRVVTWSGFLGLFLGVLVARRPLSTLTSWLLILGYGLVFNIFYLGRLLPSLSTLLRGEGGAIFRHQWALLLDRLLGWYLALQSGSSSSETLVFAFLLGLIVWLLAAYAAWSTYRQRRALGGLTLLGLALAFNGYYGSQDAPIWLFALFIGIAALLAATMHFSNMEQRWLATGIDYSQEIRVEMLAVAGGVALLLATVSLLLPGIRLSALARPFQDSAPVQQAEQAAERAFAGVRQPRQEPVVFVGRTAGILPRSFLLGNPPSLYETLVMTATVQPDVGATHWRALSYDVYTGRGWALSEERRETVSAGEMIPFPLEEGQTTVTQTVSLFPEEHALRYTMGRPLRFDHDVAVYWRGVDDFARADGLSASYGAASALTTARPSQLRQAAVADVPPALLARYTQLPSAFPERVAALAAEVTADAATPYDQARALEAFLRQYPYSLDVERPPSRGDLVEFFLFDLQSGYCDYYASAMTVMARSLGLPARLATGYLAQPPRADGVQEIYQINAHAWSEVYFAGYGWVEFEPTAPFPSTAGGPAGAQSGAEEDAPEPAATPPPIPQRSRSPLSSWLIAPLIALVLGLWLWWHRRASHSAAADDVLWAYSRLLRSARRMGLNVPPTKTPAEFETLFLARLARWQRHPWLAPRIDDIRTGVTQLTALFSARQYSSQKPAPSTTREARRVWQRLAWPLWLLALLKKVTRKAD